MPSERPEMREAFLVAILVLLAGCNAAPTESKSSPTETAGPSLPKAAVDVAMTRFNEKHLPPANEERKVTDVVPTEKMTLSAADKANGVQEKWRVKVLWMSRDKTDGQWGDWEGTYCHTMTIEKRHDDWGVTRSDIGC